MLFLVIFVIIPFAEIAVFIQVGEQIGLGYTLLTALATAIIGGLIVRYQGVQTLFSMRNKLETGAMPVDDILNGVCLIAAGAMLITPGFVTDTLGFALLVPPVRSLIIDQLIKRVEIRGAHNSHSGHSSRGYQNNGEAGNVIEGEYKKLDE